MKKNFSLLKSVGFVSAAALVGLSAYAGISIMKKLPAVDGKTEVWVVPTEKIKAGDEVTFIGFDATGAGKQLLNNANGDTTPYEYSNYSTVKFAAKASAQTTAPAGSLLFEGATEKNYLRNDGTITLNDDLPEVQWVSSFTSATQQTLKNNADSKYLYYDVTSNRFKTTTDTSVKFCTYVRGYVTNPTVTDNGATGDVYTLAGTGYSVGTKVVDGAKTYLRYSTDATYTNPVITVSTTETAQAGYVQYSLDGTTWVGDNSNGKSLTITLATLGTGTKTIKSRFVVTNGTANCILGYAYGVDKVYEIVLLNNPTVSNPDASAAPYTTAKYPVSGTTTFTFSTAQLAKVADATAKTAEAQAQAVSYNASTATASIAKVFAYESKFMTTPADWAFTMNPNKTADEIAAIFSTFSATSSNSKGATYAVKGDVITFGYTSPMDGYTISGKAATFKVKINGVEVDATNGADGKATVTVPDAITTTTAVTLDVPAGSFQATSGYNKYDQPAAAQAKFNSLYVGKTFTIDPAYNNISDRVADAQFDFKITGVNDNEILVLDGNYATTTDAAKIKSVVKVTNTANVAVGTDWTMTYNTTTKKYHLAFTGTIPAGDYLVVFPAGTLVDAATPVAGTTHTNQYNVTAYINVKEYVTFAYTLGKVENNVFTAATKFCENDNVYMQITTNTASNQHPQYKKGTAEALLNSGSYELLGKASTLVTPTVEGADYTKGIAAEAYSANCNKNEAASAAAVKVYKHLTYAGTTAVPADVNSTTVEFTLTAKDGATTPVNYPAVLAGTYSVQVGGKTTALVIDATGKGTLTLPSGADKLATGTYTINFAKGTFNTTGDPCGSNAFTQDIVLGNVVFKIPNPAAITTNDKTFTIGQVQAGVGTATANAIACGAEKFVYETVNGSLTAVGKVNTATGVVTLDAKPTAGTHTYSFSDGAYTYAASASKRTDTFSVEVHNYVTFTVVDKQYKEESKENTSLTFQLQVSPTTDAPWTTTTVIPTFKTAETKLPATAPLAAVFTLNDGTDKTITPSDITVNETPVSAGVYEVTVKFGQKLVPNNYVLNIGVNGVGAKNMANSNDKNLYVHFQVFKKVNFYGTTTYAKPGNTVTLNATNNDKKGIAVDEEDVVRNAQMTVNKAGWTLDGTALAEDKIAVGADNAITITAPAALAIGTHKVVAPAKAFTVDASTNAAAVEFTIEVVNVAFAIDNVTKSLAYSDQAAWCAAPEFPVKVYTVDANGAKVADITALAQANVTSFTTTLKKDDTAYGTPSVDAGKVKFAVSPALAVGNYKLNVPANELKVSYQNLEFNNAAITADVTVNNNFYFANNVNGKSTLNSTLPATAATYDIVYSQDFNAVGKMEALCLPFDVNVANLAGKANIYKINTVVKSEGNVYFKIEKLTTGTAKAGKPYVIEPLVAKIEKLSLGSASIAQVADNTTGITCSSTNDAVSFFRTYVEANSENFAQVIVKPGDTEPKYNTFYAIAGGAFKYMNVTKTTVQTISLWSWYALGKQYLSTDSYVKFFVEGEDDATLINAISSDENAEIYNLSGQKLNKAQKGINIINGKKVLVK